MRRTGPGIAALVLALALLVAGCGAPSTTSRSSPPARGRHHVSTTTTTPPTTTTTPPDVPCTGARALQSLAPSELSPIDQMPAGSTMRRIQEHGQLVVGVDENTPRLAGRDPASGEIDGFEVELVRHIAARDPRRPRGGEVRDRGHRGEGRRGRRRRRRPHRQRQLHHLRSVERRLVQQRVLHRRARAPGPQRLRHHGHRRSHRPHRVRDRGLVVGGAARGPGTGPR